MSDHVRHSGGHYHHERGPRPAPEGLPGQAPAHPPSGIPPSVQRAPSQRVQLQASGPLPTAPGGPAPQPGYRASFEGHPELFANKNIEIYLDNFITLEIHRIYTLARVQSTAEGGHNMNPEIAKTLVAQRHDELIKHDLGVSAHP